MTLFVEKFYEQGKANYSASGEGYDAVFNKDILELGEKSDWLEDIFDGFMDTTNNIVNTIFKGLTPTNTRNTPRTTTQTPTVTINDSDKSIANAKFQTFILVKRQSYFAKDDIIMGGMKFINDGYKATMPQAFKSEGERLYFLIVDPVFYNPAQFSLGKEGAMYKMVVSYPLSGSSFNNIKNGKSADSMDINAINALIKNVNNLNTLVEFEASTQPGCALNYITDADGPNSLYRL